MVVIEKAVQGRAGMRLRGRISLWKTLKTWALRHRSRQSLARLDDHMLRDIGLDLQTARRECTKGFWQD